ncbi:MerR family transcriptional regulator [Mycolicibacterium moriokaense]|nr:MerR family transcriptional regulator [Mycolicibacterium moriokaense]
MSARPDGPPRVRAQPRQPAGPISTILAGLRRAPRQIRRGSRDVIETAVSQLFDAAVQPHGVAASGEYRIEELARLAGTTTRNIRVYRDRGLLHPPLRVGRIVLFNDTHLTRLRLITSLLDRGYNIAHVHEMLSAWEQGKDVGDMLGLESAIAGSWATEKPERMSVADAKRLVDDDPGFERMVGLGVIKLEGEGSLQEAIVVRPKLIEAFNEIRQYGITTDKLIDVHEQVAPLIDQISGLLVTAGIEEVLHRIKPGAALPPDTEVAELITILVRLRTVAVSAVSATLAFSIESTIESAVGEILGDLIDKEAGKEADRPGSP